MVWSALQGNSFNSLIWENKRYTHYVFFRENLYNNSRNPVEA